MLIVLFSFLAVKFCALLHMDIALHSNTPAQAQKHLIRLISYNGQKNQIVVTFQVCFAAEATSLISV